MALQILLKLDKNGKTIQAELRFIWKYKEHCARSNSCADVEKKNSHDGTWLSGPSVPQQNGTETREALSNSGWNDCRCLGQNNWSKCHRGEQRRELPASATRLQELERWTELREKPVLSTTFILCVWTCEEECTADDGVFTHVGQNGEMQQDGERLLSRILCSEANHEQRGSSGGLWFRVLS